MHAFCTLRALLRGPLRPKLWLYIRLMKLKTLKVWEGLEDLAVHSTVQPWIIACSIIHGSTYPTCACCTTLQHSPQLKGLYHSKMASPSNLWLYLLTLRLKLIRHEQASLVMNLYVFSKLNGPF